MKSRYFADKSAKYLVFVCASISFLILIAIIVFTVRDSLPALREIGILEFFGGTVWRPGQESWGLLQMIWTTFYVTALAMVIAIPLGIGCAVLLAEIAPPRVRAALRPAIELLVGIPSVVYGLVGMTIIVPFIRDYFGSPTGYSILAAALVLAVMVLPTIVSISEDSLRALPKSHREGALALGATQWQTIWRVLLPAARSGMVASIILGMGRAVGETMAMIMVIGNSIKMPLSPLDAGRTLTGNIAVEIAYAPPLHKSALFVTGVVLFIVIMILNSTALIALRRGRRREN